MPAFIKSDPESVLISAWSVTQKKKARITWDTGSTAVLGKVYLSIDGGADEVFDGDPDGKSSGDKEQVIELGKTYDFQLKRDLLQYTVLATLRIRGEEKLGTTSGLPKFMENMIPKSQGIYGLKVNPGIDSVRIRFRTRQAAPAYIEIKNDNTQAVVAGALLGNQLVYDVLIAKGIGFTLKALEHDTNYTFQIVALALPGSSIPGDKTLTGQFVTGGRTAEVKFESILVHDDGDPGFYLGGGDFRFYFGAGDVDTGENLGNADSYGPETIWSGEFRNVNCVVTIPSATAGLWVQVRAQEDDTSGAYGIAGPATSFAPPGTTCRHSVIGPDATVTEHFDFSALTDGLEERPVKMTNHSCPIHFTVVGRLRVEAHSGALLQPFIQRSAPRSPVPRVGTLLGAGERVIVGTGSGKAHAIRLAPGGAVFATTLSNRPAAPEEGWTRIGGEVAGSLTVVASGPDRVSLFAVGPDGVVAHKTLSRDVPPNDEWKTLHGDFVGPVAAAVGADGRIEIFGLAGDGRVFHRTLSPAGGGQAARDWQLIGDGVGGSLTAFSSPRGDVSVVALGRGGEVLHKLRRGDEWRPVGCEWQSLGAAPAGPLCAELVEDDIVVLAVLAENETIQLLPWRNYPDKPPGDGWQCVGTINSLLHARLSLIEPPLDADRSSPAAPAGSPQPTTSPSPGS